ncbi:MAG: DUF11 domain-containing protein, partial [Ketobacter sp.]|nr:DUF11 domain-containing protein [Ketobacter sp.]
CTLPEAIANANADADTTGGDCPAGVGVDTITLPGGTYPGTSTLPLADTQLTTVNGDGPTATVLNYSMWCQSGASCALRRLTIDKLGSGRGVLSDGILSLSDCRLTGGSTRGLEVSFGAAVTTVDRCTIDNNSLSAGFDGGAGALLDGTATVTNSTISNNVALGTNGGGGLRHRSGTLTLIHTTITGNTAAVKGGGIDAAASVQLQSSIVSGNTAPTGADCGSSGTTSLGYNIVGSGGSAGGCADNGTTDVVPAGAAATVVDPSLADNGGGLPTHALAGASAAVDLVPAGTNGCGLTVIDDQRGVARPLAGGCDAGAVEQGFVKSFTPAVLATGGTATLTFTIENAGNASALGSLAFTDALPAGVVVATPSGLANTCGGTVTATAGSGSISLSSGSVAAGSSCTIDVDVTSSATGAHVNVSSLLATDAGDRGKAGATLFVIEPPAFSKVFGPDLIAPASTSTLTFTIDSAANPAAVGSLAFTDTLPAGVVVASPNGLANPCGGTVTATAGSGSISLAGGSVAAGSSCTIDVDVTSSTSGAHVNLTGTLGS